MSVVAGVDVGNATTEVVLVSGGTIVGSGRVPTRGRKGSPDSLRGAAALVRRLERQAGCTVTEVRIAPLRAVGTSLVTVPEVAPATGRLRVLAAGVPTPGGVGVCVGRPLRLLPAPASVPGGTGLIADGDPMVVLVPDGVGFERAARLLRELVADGVRVGAVLVAGDEGVLIANRLPSGVPVIDQVDVDTAAGCELLAVEVCPPGRPLRLLTDAVALGAGFDLDAGETTRVCRTLTDYSNAVVGRTSADSAGPGGSGPGGSGPGGSGADGQSEPWVVTVAQERLALRSAAGLLADWPPGMVRAFGTGKAADSGAVGRSAGTGREGDSGGAGRSAAANGPVEVAVDDLFAVDLSEIAEAATARQGATARAILVAALDAATRTVDAADELAGLLGVPVRCPLTEPVASRLGALTTPGADDEAVVIDLGAGTIDVIAADEDVVAAGAGELLTAAVAQALGIPRAAADWVKRGPCIRVDGGQRYEAEDGTRGFLDVPAPASATGMLAVRGPGGLLPFDRRLSPAEWRAMRVRIKSAVMIKNSKRAMGQLTANPSQLLVVGGPAGDEELLGLLARALPDGVAVGRGNIGGTLGPRYAVALGLGLAH